MRVGYYRPAPFRARLPRATSKPSARGHYDRSSFRLDNKGRSAVLCAKNSAADVSPRFYNGIEIMPRQPRPPTFFKSAALGTAGVGCALWPGTYDAAVRVVDTAEKAPGMFFGMFAASAVLVLGVDILQRLRADRIKRMENKWLRFICQRDLGMGIMMTGAGLACTEMIAHANDIGGDAFQHAFNDFKLGSSFIAVVWAADNALEVGGVRMGSKAGVTLLSLYFLVRLLCLFDDPAHFLLYLMREGSI